MSDLLNITKTIKFTEEESDIVDKLLHHINLSKAKNKGKKKETFSSLVRSRAILAIRKELKEIEKKGWKMSTLEELKDEANENEKPTIMEMYEKLSDSCMTQEELIQLMDDIILTTLNDNHKDIEIAISDKFHAEFWRWKI